MKPVTPDILKGLNNVLRPGSPAFAEGYACDSTNSRIDKEGIWNKGPALGDVSSAPAVKAVPTKAGTHFRDMVVKDAHIIASGLGNDDSIATGLNKYAYFEASGVPKWWDGDGIVENTDYGTAGLDRPTVDPTVSVSGTGARQEEGIYYYFYTYYNTARRIESLPSDVIEHWVRKYFTNDLRQADVPNLTGTAATGCVLRWYRSKVHRIRQADSLQMRQENSPTEFYYIGEGTTFADYAHDTEITDQTNRYCGRGSKPPQTAIDAIGHYEGRMFYLVGNIAYWSSFGRPEEVPQSYTLTINCTYTNGTWSDEVLTAGEVVEIALTQRPLLDTGQFAETKMVIPKLEGLTITAAIEFGGKLWLFTAHTTGYIQSSAPTEGFRYVEVASDVGCVNPNVLAVTPYGLFGADSKGMWRLTDAPRRISYGRIDIDDSGKSTYMTGQAASFGVWIAELNEYWWSCTNVQLAYQVDRDIFVGPYQLTLTGGCAFVSSGGAQCYLTGAKTPVLSSRTGAQVLKFWLGEGWQVTDNWRFEVLYTGITAAKTVTVKTYHNSQPSETGAQESSNWSHTASNLVGLVELKLSGRFCELSLSIPADCAAPVAGINYTASPVVKEERHGR